MFGARTMPERLRPAWEAFTAQAERVEAARQALLGCLPVGRVDPAPIPVGLDLVGDELAAVARDLERWRVPEVEQAWLAVRDALEEAEAAIEPARSTAASTTELEELLEAVGEVTVPLDAWGEAERAWLRLRERPRRDQDLDQETKRPRGPRGSWGRFVTGLSRSAGVNDRPDGR